MVATMKVTYDCAKTFDDFFDVRKVTIQANNNGAGGYTLFTPKERYVSFPSKKYMFSQMVVAMAGRAAEILLYEPNALLNDGFNFTTNDLYSRRRWSYRCNF